MFISAKESPGRFSLKPVFEGISQVLYGDPHFPSNLIELEAFPERLFYRGTLQPSDSQAVAIVGSRASTPAGTQRAFRLGQELADHGVCVVSGLARGIDAAAHRGALEAGGRTVAVLGTGLNHVYPPEHQALSERIAQGGAVVSQFSPCFTGHPGGRNFRKRNALVSGLSRLVVVVEAQLRSGTANTIKHALAQGRKVGLLRSLVESQRWAAELAEHHLVFTVHTTECVLERMA
jgi:DNA processing protein